MANKRVWVSFLEPREGHIDVEANTNEDAKKMVEELMGPNRSGLNIVRVTDIPTQLELPYEEVTKKVMN